MIKKKKKKTFIRIYGIICTFIFIGPTQLQKEYGISTTREKDPFSIFLEVLFYFFYFHSFECAFMMHTITNSLTIINKKTTHFIAKLVPFFYDRFLYHYCNR